MASKRTSRTSSDQWSAAAARLHKAKSALLASSFGGAVMDKHPDDLKVGDRIWYQLNTGPTIAEIVRFEDGEYGPSAIIRFGKGSPIRTTLGLDSSYLGMVGVAKNRAKRGSRGPKRNSRGRGGYPMTTQKQVRDAFWEMVEEYRPAGVSRRRISNYAGTGKMHNTDTRVAFVDFVDYLSKDGQISDALANRVTLG